MKIKELEIKVNDKIKEYGYNKPENESSYENQAYRVGRLIEEVLKENGIETKISCWPKQNDLIVRFGDYDNKEIYVKVRRKKGTTHHSIGFWSSTTYYYLKDMEFYLEDKEETIENLFEEWIKTGIEKKNKENSDINHFNDTLKNKNLSLDEFKNLMNLYNKYRYKLDEDWWRF